MNKSKVWTENSLGNWTQLKKSLNSKGGNNKLYLIIFVILLLLAGATVVVLDYMGKLKLGIFPNREQNNNNNNNLN